MGPLMDTSATLECPKNLVGRVIGRGGETTNELQNKSGTRIQIDKRQTRRSLQVQCRQCRLACRW